jgi:flagellin
MSVKGVLVGAENIQAAESLIRDTDMAEQMVEFVKNTILVQSGTAMLAQANLKPQSVLQLLI